MKTLFLFSIILVLSVSIFAQSKSVISVRFNAKMDTLVEPIYQVPKPGITAGETTVVLNMTYADSKILNPEAAFELSEGLCNVSSVDLVYTGDDNMELMDKLNKRRLFELYLLAPDIFNQSMVQWRSVKQTGYTKPKGASKLFHGFVIHYKKIVRYIPSNPIRMREDVVQLSKKFEDSTILKSLNRNPEWSKEIIVADVTGSMSPYYKELMAWFYLKKFERNTTFAFFNDGDTKADIRKTIGSTGGVYTFTTNNMDTLLSYAYSAVSNGSGGDAPENNIEAILKAVEVNPSAKEVILIADNWADMRDISLMSFVKKPVRIILCGISGNVNSQYLELARNTKGSLHTIDEDIDNLMSLREGEEIKIAGLIYILKGGRFIRK